MTKKDIIRSWKDAEYRISLSETERAKLPEHPAGLIDLTDVELATVAGGGQKKTVGQLCHTMKCKK